MAEDPKRDLHVAAELLERLGLPETADLVRAMQAKGGPDGNQLRRFLAAYGREMAGKRPTGTPVIQDLSRVVSAALEGPTQPRRRRLARSGPAPSLDRALQRIDRVFPALHDVLEALAKSRNRQAAVLMALFAHAIRWQILEELVTELVDHWGAELPANDRFAARQALLVVEVVDESSRSQVATWDYRRAIVHGDFEVGVDGLVQFWTTDPLGRTQPLPPLRAPAILELYNSSEAHLRTIEAFARVLRAWGLQEATKARATGA